MIRDKMENSAVASKGYFDDLWYVPDKRLRTKSAAEKAACIAQWIQNKKGLDRKPTEEDLFIAMHTCAYRATRRSRKQRITRRERTKWIHLWKLIRNHIVEQNLGLVYSMIGRFGSKTMDEDDMLSDAMFGLARAVDRYNPWRGYRFSTYACNVIARALMRRGKRESHYRQVFPVQNDVSFEHPEELPDPHTELFVERLNMALDQNQGELTELESAVLTRRFPLDYTPRMTFQEIGNSVGLSKERVRQIQNIALRKLRDVLDQDPVLG